MECSRRSPKPAGEADSATASAAASFHAWIMLPYEQCAPQSRRILSSRFRNPAVSSLRFLPTIQVVSHQAYNHKCDVFSYGILLWEMVTGGAVPYAGFTPLQACLFSCCWNEIAFGIPNPSLLSAQSALLLLSTSTLVANAAALSLRLDSPPPCASSAQPPLSCVALLGPSCSNTQAAVGVVQKGLRPVTPEGCNLGLLRLMQLCWDSYPAARPDFEQVLQILPVRILSAVALPSGGAARTPSLRMSPRSQSCLCHVRACRLASRPAALSSTLAAASCPATLPTSAADHLGGAIAGADDFVAVIGASWQSGGWGWEGEAGVLCANAQVRSRCRHRRMQWRPFSPRARFSGAGTPFAEAAPGGAEGPARLQCDWS